MLRVRGYKLHKRPWRGNGFKQTVLSTCNSTPRAPRTSYLPAPPLLPADDAVYPPNAGSTRYHAAGMEPFFHDDDVSAKYEPNGSGGRRIGAGSGGGTAVGPAECTDGTRCRRRHLSHPSLEAYSYSSVWSGLPTAANGAKPRARAFLSNCTPLKLAHRHLHTRRSAAPHSLGRAVCLCRGDACMLQDSEHGFSMKTDARGCRADGRCARDSRTPALVFGSR